MVDASCEGAFKSKSEDEAYILFETLSKNLINHASLSFYIRSISPQNGQEFMRSNIQNLILRQTRT